MVNAMHMRAQQATSIPHRPALLNMHTDGSSTEDFRSVIDDLTIENKKLKKKLKRYQKIQDAHLQDEKLFEVRVHGLPPHKKRELEETLRKFAMDMDDGTTGDSTGMTLPAPPTLPTLSSYTSTQFADSAYHSVSVSGQTSNAASGGKVSSSQPDKSRYHRQQDSIQSYLQDIPLGLMPRTTAMTESAKKKMIVRRMEQIFAGKGAVLEGHHQPIQQQEVSQSAAQADRDALEQATGQEARKEGLREARIMKKARKESVTGDDVVAPNQKHNLRSHILDQDFAASGGHQSPDQRPTRPLDLDPQRAQVPTENINYIRHLGFSPPDPDTSPIDDHGWIYLNLLVNMAQLHTVNVTTDFVKKALQGYSTKLELSHDGRKVRWKGGHSVSLISSDSSPERESEQLKPNVKKMGKKRQKLGPSSTNTSSEITGQSPAYRNRLAYTPLFYHKESTEGSVVSNVSPNSEEEVSPLAPQATGTTPSGLASSGVRTSSLKRKRDEGPIIFYNKANFCTDLSGDPGVHNAKGYVDYNHYSDIPLGASPEQYQTHGNVTNDERRGPLMRAALQDMDVDMDPSSSSDVDLDFTDTQPLDGNISVIPSVELDFEASGIGGIVPEDNFAIDVASKRVRGDGASATNFASHTPRSLHYPHRITRALKREYDEDQTASSPSTVRRAPIVNREIISMDHRLLPPSVLPPPSLLPFGSSSGDADSDMSDVSDMGEGQFEDTDEPPTAAPRLLDVTPEESEYNEENEDEDEEDEGEEEDGSVDFLAQARQLDPETIRQCERQYDADLAERLAEEIPAGSSAATAGGGSGFNTPKSKADGDETDQRPSSRDSDGLQQSMSLKRSRTSDSMIVHGKAERQE